MSDGMTDEEKRRDQLLAAPDATEEDAAPRIDVTQRAGNVTRIDTALAEAFRVLKPGGRFFCLEFSHVIDPTLAKIYDAYSFNVIPRIGQAVAKDRDSYQYLVESIRKMPTQKELARRIGQAGFGRARFDNLTFGVAAIHQGWKI